MGRIVWSGLCIFMRLFMVGAEGFKFVNFNLDSCGISVELWFTVFPIWIWKVFVGFVVEV
jgi:hypothetical protein